jgi:hypothetical protein
MHLTHPVRDTGIKQDALGRRRFPGINMGHDADIPSPL